MSEAGEVLARLRKRAEACRLSGNPMMAEEFDEYTNTLDSLQAQVEGMREALEPFALFAAQHVPVHYSFPMIEVIVGAGNPVTYTSDWHRARTALSPIKASDAERREINDAND